MENITLNTRKILKEVRKQAIFRARGVWRGHVGENLNEWDSFRKMNFLRLINLFKNYFENSLITINSRTIINKNKRN